MIPPRTLGTLTVPAVGFGAMVLSPGMYGRVDDAGAVDALRYALDLGVTFVDTADAYGPEGTTNVWSARPSAAAGTRWCWPPSSA